MNACNPPGKRFWFHKSTKWFPQKVHIFVAQNQDWVEFFSGGKVLIRTILRHNYYYCFSVSRRNGSEQWISAVSRGTDPGNIASSLDTPNGPGTMADSGMAETPEISQTQSLAPTSRRCLDLWRHCALKGQFLRLYPTPEGIPRHACL